MNRATDHHWYTLLLLCACACSGATTPGSDQSGAGGDANTPAGEAGEAGTGQAPGQAGGGGEGGARACDGESLDCDDCPTLDEYRASCAPAQPTTCGGTMVGPLRTEGFEYVYCYAADGALTGRIVDDLGFPSIGALEGWGCDPQGASQSLCGDDGPPPVLEAESETIEISYSSFFEGGFLFQRRVDQLGPRQLELARAIHIVPPTGECWEDGGSAVLTITAGDSERKFFANEYNGTCGRRDSALVDATSVMALLDTAGCLPAKAYDATSPETAPTISPDSGCQHGLFNAYDALGQWWWFRAEIPAASTYTFAVSECGDRVLELELFEEDAATSVASIAGDGACPVLTHAFDAPGSYLLRVEMVGGRYAGDFLLSLESSP